MAQVRLDGDVAEALRAVAEREGSSVAHEANRRLRTALGLSAAPRSRPGAPAGRPTMPRRPASIAAPPVRCPHPIGRRIGGQCAACGAVVR